MANHVVIMAGGVGSRFWPLSTPEYPKQFLDILGCGSTLIQLTVARFKGICSDANLWVVTNRDYVEIVRKQIPTIPQNHVLAEPAARNTAPCVAWACWCIRREDPEANVVVTPSDAIVMDTLEFQRVVRGALEFTAQSDGIVTLGIKPNRPETGYGYVKMACDASVASSEIVKVEAFREKPDLDTAKSYLQYGGYLWNAGIFVWNVNTITDSIQIYKPNLAAMMELMVVQDRVEELFPQCEKVSIDYAVMEPAAAQGRVYTFPCSFGWSDLGNWQSLHEKLEKDESNNAAVGNVDLYECANCVVHAKELNKVVLQGLDGYIVAHKNGRLLICRRSEEQRIKEFASI